MATGSPDGPVFPVFPTTTGFLPRERAEIYYEVTGNGLAVVFAHGLGGNQPVLHFLYRGAGFGSSGRTCRGDFCYNY